MDLTPEQLEEGQSFLAAFRAEQAEERMKTGELVIELEKDTSDANWNESAYRDGLKEFKEKLDQAGIQYQEIIGALESLGADALSLGEFTIRTLGPPAIGVVTAVVSGWLAGRAGRKVRLKFGEVEAEGRTPEEVEQLLKSAAAFQATLKEAGKEK